MKRLFGGSAGTHMHTTLIAEGAVFEGTIRFSGTLEIEGRVIGDIFAESDSAAVIRVMRTGQVRGNIDVPLVIVNGGVTGNIKSTDHVELAAHAIVVGDVYYNLIEMMKGAQVNGSLVFNESESRLT